MLNSKKRAVLSLIFATLIWASTYAVVKIGLQDIAPLTLSLIRGVIAAIILFTFCAVKGLLKEGVAFIKQHYWIALLLGLLDMLIQSFQNFGLKNSSSIMGGILINVSPIFILFLSILFLKESPNRNKILGIILGFVGILIMTLLGEDFSSFSVQNTIFGNILLLGVAVSWAIYSVVVKKYLNEFRPLTLTFISYFVGTLLFIPLTLLTEDVTVLNDYSARAWLIIAYLGVFGSAAAYLFWNYGVKYIEVSKASIYQYLSPAIAIIIGFLFLHEKIDFFDMAGIALVFGGIYISGRTYSN